jgi:CheY-like chemotaxis protein/nitrogen-specific signal transduction histidine kinase
MRGVAIEVSERLQAERDRSELLTREQEARRAAEEANRLKDEFLMTLSHELRTPLNAILGWACLLRDSRLDAEKQARAIETIERNARAQTQLIEGLLDMSRIITGKVRLELGPVSLTTTASAVVDSMRPAAEAKGIRLELAADPDVEAVPGDGDRLQQVVWNLVSNAIKFTPDGGRVQVRIRQLYDRVMLAVSDSGQGVKEEELPHIFDRFRQGERAQGGLGLGLAIVRSLVEMHGGSVEARSLGENLGATFVVRLPMFAAPVHRAEAASATPVVEVAPALRGQLGGLRVLIVDDAPDARELAQVMLEQAGASVRLASTAQEALAALDAFQPQAIVSDLVMPGTNGFELMREIRAREAASGRPAVPAVALSAYARPEDRRAALDAGYHLHLAKPVGAHDLSAALAALAATATA